MADEELEIILRAIDDASGTFESVGSSAESVASTLQTAFDEATSNVDRLTEELAAIEMGDIEGDFDAVAAELAEAEAEAERLGTALDEVNGAGMDEVSSGADEAASSTQQADEAVQDLNNDLGIVNASSLFELASQIGDIGAQAETMAQGMNEATVTIGQLGIQSGIADDQLISMVNTITNAAFPHEDAMLYIKSLDQIGVSSENLAKSATDLDAINDAFGLGAEKTNSLGQELSVLGVDMNNVSESFNALAYANANTVGGMDNYYNFLRKYDAQFNQLGYNVDQASVIIAAATQKFGGGRAALSGLSDALKTAGNDSAALEQALGLPAGAISNASQLTGEYSGQLQSMADLEEENTTILQKLGDAWDDFSLSVGESLSPLLSIGGAIGQIGQFGLQIGGLKELGSALRSSITLIKDFNIAQTAKNLVEGEGAIASLAAALGITTEAAAAEGATVAFGGLAVAEGAALWPILAIVAAIVALIAIVYEVGKAFGWWTDVGSMIDAIWAGIQRLWNAFINHPDVQGAISAISGAFQWLMSTISGAWNALMEFLGVSTGGEFDIVHEIIMAIGAAWEMITAPIRAVIGLITSLVTIFSQLATGQIDLQTAFMLVWNALLTFFQTMTQSIFFVVMQFAANLLSAAVQAGSNLLTGVITYVSRLPGRVYTYLLNVATRITAMGARWVSIARVKANLLVLGIITYLMQLPGKVFSALMGVVGRITGAIGHWINAAKSKVRDVINAITSPFSGVAGAISGALSGVTNAIKAPFEAAWNAIEPLVSKIRDGMKLIGAAGGEMAAGGESLDVNTNRNFNISTGEYTIDDSPIVIEDNLNISLDLRGVPRGVNTNELVTAIQDRNVLNALVTNRDFQDLDARVKQRINLKNVRARGR